MQAPPLGPPSVVRRAPWATALLAAVAIACSSDDEPSSAKPDSGLTEAGTDAASDAVDGDAAACSPPATLGLGLTVVLAGQPLEGASVRTVPCGGPITTGSDGVAPLTVAPSFPFTVAVEHPQIFPQLVGEWSLTKDYTFGDVFLDSNESETLQASPSEALLVPRYLSPAPTDQSGISVTVDGHPEAKVTYLDAGWQPLPAATSTDAGGRWVIRGLADGFVQVSATKAGLSLQTAPAKVFMTGRVPVKKGFISHVVVAFGPPAGDGGPPPPPPPPPPDEPGKVWCAGVSCSVASEQCCAPAMPPVGPAAQCQKAGTACAQIAMRCDDASDCPSGQICCGASGPGKVVECKPLSECSSAANESVHCAAKSCPGGLKCDLGPWGYFVCH